MPDTSEHDALEKFRLACANPELSDLAVILLFHKLEFDSESDIERKARNFLAFWRPGAEAALEKESREHNTPLHFPT